MVRHLSSNEAEAANRAEATALLIRAGFRVYRPEADVQGEDLAIRAPDGSLRMVQLKGRPAVDWSRYGGKSIWMLFPEPGYVLGRPWFLIEHDILFSWMEQRHGMASKWKAGWSYPSLTKDLRQFLADYRQDKWDAGGLAGDPPDQN